MKTVLTKLRTDYHVCPDCGGTLDIGEQCECQSPERDPNERIAGILEQTNPLHGLFSQKERTPNGGDRQSVHV